jgi:uncharacterized membrane protein
MVGREGKQVNGLRGRRRSFCFAITRDFGLPSSPALWAFFLLPGGWELISRILVSWNVGVALFLVLIFTWMTRMSPELICSRYIDEDESAPFILAVVVLAALLSVAAIVQPLATLKHVTGTERVAHMVLAAVTLVSSWLLVPTMFTTHYADMFYSVPARRSVRSNSPVHHGRHFGTSPTLVSPSPRPVRPRMCRRQIRRCAKWSLCTRWCRFSSMRPFWVSPSM